MHERYRRNQAPAKTLSLKKTETSTVKQSFSHGRTKAVVVEKKRTLGRRPRRPSPRRKACARAEEAKAATPAETPAAAPPRPRRARGVVLRQLSDEEKARRGRRPCRCARLPKSKPASSAEEEARRRAVEEEKLKREARRRRKAQGRRRCAQGRRSRSSPASTPKKKPRAATEQSRTNRPPPLRQPPRSRCAARAPSARRRRGRDHHQESRRKISRPRRRPPKKVGEGERRRGKLTVTRALSGDDERTRSVAAYRRHLQRVNKGAHQAPAGPAGPRESPFPKPSRSPNSPTAWRAASSTSSRC